MLLGFDETTWPGPLCSESAPFGGWQDHEQICFDLITDIFDTNCLGKPSLPDELLTPLFSLKARTHADRNVSKVNETIRSVTTEFLRVLRKSFMISNEWCRGYYRDDDEDWLIISPELEVIIQTQLIKSYAEFRRYVEIDKHEEDLGHDDVAVIASSLLETDDVDAPLYKNRVLPLDQRVELIAMHRENKTKGRVVTYDGTVRSTRHAAILTLPDCVDWTCGSEVADKFHEFLRERQVDELGDTARAIKISAIQALPAFADWDASCELRSFAWMPKSKSFICFTSAGKRFSLTYKEALRRRFKAAFLDAVQNEPEKKIKVWAGNDRAVSVVSPGRLSTLPIVYPQAGKDACVFYSFASSLASCGATRDAQLVYTFATNSLGVSDPQTALCDLVRNEMSKKWIVVNYQRGYDVFAQRPFPTILRLEGEDGAVGHTVTTVFDIIFDAAESHALRLCKASLDACVKQDKHDLYNFRRIDFAIQLRPQPRYERAWLNLSCRSLGSFTNTTNWL
jgi:hypothetical protein